MNSQLESRPWLDDVLVVVAAVLTFARGVPHQLIQSWDDKRFLIEFEPVQQIDIESLVAIWSEPHFEAYHPLHLMSYWLDVPLTWTEGGPNGFVVHAVSLALWCGALLPVRRVMLAWGLGRVPALVATLAVGLHPIQVEAVTWATGRKEIVAMILGCACVLAHLRSESSWDKHAWLSRLAYVGAALAKTTVLPLPLVLMAHDILIRERDLRAAVLAQLPGLAVGLGLGWLVVDIWQANEMIRPPPEGLGPIALVASTYTHHLGTAVLPLWTSPVYPVHRTLSDFSWIDVVGPLVLLGAIIKGRPRLRFTAFAFAVLLAPVSNLWPLYFEVQDRYLSLPLLPLGFGLGALLQAAAETRFAHRINATGAGAVLLFAISTVIYQGAWASDAALWEHASSTHPESFYAQLKVGEIHRNAGEYDDALAAYEQAIAQEPDLRLGHAARFQTLALIDEQRRGLEPSRAIELSQRYVQTIDDFEGLRELGGDMINMGYRRGVLQCLARSLDLHPIVPERLESAALIQLDNGNDWLAEFYVSRLGRAPFDPRLLVYVED